MFDLREDMMVESWAIAGMNPGGELNAEFVWTLQGSEMKLAPVNGKTYNKLQAFERDESSGVNKIQTTTKYVVGSAYSTPSGSKRFIYLGLDPETNKNVFYEYFEYKHSAGEIVYYNPEFVGKPARVRIDDPLIDSKPLSFHMDQIEKGKRERLDNAIKRSAHVYSGDYRDYIKDYQDDLDRFVALRARLGI